MVLSNENMTFEDCGANRPKNTFARCVFGRKKLCGFFLYSVTVLEIKPLAVEPGRVGIYTHEPDLYRAGMII